MKIKLPGLMKKLEMALRPSLWLVVAAMLVAGCSKPGVSGEPKPQAAAEAPKAQDDRTALDEYVAAPDTNYSFRVVSNRPAKVSPPSSWT